MKAIVLTGWRHMINVVSIIRTADGLGFDDFIVTGRKKLDTSWLKKTAKRSLSDWIHRPKLVNLPTIELIRDYLKDRGYTPVVMELNEKSVDIKDFVWPENPAIIVGHEREGVDNIFLENGYRKVFLPMSGNISCLNVGCAASIAMYDYVFKSELINSAKNEN